MPANIPSLSRDRVADTRQSQCYLVRANHGQIPAPSRASRRPGNRFKHRKARSAQGCVPVVRYCHPVATAGRFVTSCEILSAPPVARPGPSTSHIEDPSTEIQRKGQARRKRYKWHLAAEFATTGRPLVVVGSQLLHNPSLTPHIVSEVRRERGCSETVATTRTRREHEERNDHV